MAELFAIDERALLAAEPDLVLAPDEDVRAHADLGNHKVIGLAFPKWRDGRGYSAARILRENKHAERKADLDQRWDAFKTKFKNFFDGDKAST